MAWFVDPFSSELMQRALAAGLLAVLATSLVGTWVVLRGLTFMGDALSHGVLPGAAAAFLLGFNLIVGALVSALVMVAGISVVNRRAKLSDDVGIGLLFVGMLALGVVIISRANSFTTDLQGLLFGNVLGVTWGDVRVEAAAAVVVVAIVVLCYRPFLALSFNVDKAATLGLRPGLSHLAMLATVAIAIVASFRAVGALLVFGLLVAPPATASLLVRRVPAIMVTAVVLGSAAVVVGLAASYHYDLAASATVAGVSVGGFFAVLAATELVALIRRSTPRPVPSP
ncbi:zinc ABC transporter permease AztB [soil metagenome]